MAVSAVVMTDQSTRDFPRGRRETQHPARRLLLPLARGMVIPLLGIGNDYFLGTNRSGPIHFEAREHTAETTR